MDVRVAAQQKLSRGCAHARGRLQTTLQAGTSVGDRLASPYHGPPGATYGSGTFAISRGVAQWFVLSVMTVTLRRLVKVRLSRDRR